MQNKWKDYLIGLLKLQKKKDLDKNGLIYDIIPVSSQLTEVLKMAVLVLKGGRLFGT